MTEKDLHVRLSTEEMKTLERYCKKTKRTKTDVIRELVRLLPDSGASNPIVGFGESMYPDAESEITARDL
jgi:Ribbon-helix-helix protein, copG family